MSSAPRVPRERHWDRARGAPRAPRPGHPWREPLLCAFSFVPRDPPPPWPVARSNHELPRLSSTHRWLPTSCPRWQCLGRCWLPPIQHAPHWAGQRGQLCRAVQPGLPFRNGSQHVRDIRRSQHAKPVPWGLWRRLPSRPHCGFWAASFCPAACSSVWNVPTAWRKPTLRGAFISTIPRSPCAWAAAPRALPRAAAPSDLPWAASSATPRAAATASAKLPWIPRVWDCHSCCAPSPV